MHLLCITFYRSVLLVGFNQRQEITIKNRVPDAAQANTVKLNTVALRLLENVFMKNVHLVHSVNLVLQVQHHATVVLLTNTRIQKEVLVVKHVQMDGLHLLSKVEVNVKQFVPTML